MRLCKLGLLAFGSFTDRWLDFGEGAPGGLHLIYGRNEAGKSTALRAVNGLLFGIPDRTEDAHLHPAQDVRVAGSIEAADGCVLDVIRRKKRKDSLRDGNDAPLEDTKLRRALSGVNRELFQRLFGLDHQALKIAGEALLAGKGDVGESLYDAGVGGAGIHHVLLGLEREAEELFKPRGQNPKLNSALEAYKEALRRKREAALAPNAFFEQRKQLEAQRTRRDRLAAERRDLQRQRDEKRRIVSVLKPVMRRRELLAERAALGVLPDLPENARETRQSAQRSLVECTREIERLELRIARQRERRAELRVDETLAGLAESAVERLAEQNALARKLSADLPAITAEIAGLQAEARTSLRRLGLESSLDAAHALRIGPAQQQRILELERERALIAERIEAAVQQRADAERAIAVKELELAEAREPTDTAELKFWSKRAQQKADLEQQIAELELEHRQLELKEAAARGALGVQPENPETWLCCELPTPEALERLDAAFRELDQRRRVLHDQRVHAERRTAELSQQIEHIEAQGELPSPEALKIERERRNALFSEISRRWRADISQRSETEVAVLEAAFERAIERADALADELRREAVRVTELNALRSQHGQAVAAVVRLQAELAPLGDEQAACELRFEAVRQALGTPARSVGELRTWLQRLADFRDLVARRRLFELTIAERQRELEDMKSGLERALGGVRPSELGVLIERATEKLEVERSVLGQRKLLTSSLIELRARSEQIQRELLAREQELAAWQRAWTEATANLGLGPEPTPGAVLAVLEELRALFYKLDQLPDKLARQREIREKLDAHRHEVEALALEHAPELRKLPPERALEELVERARRALRDARERERLDGEIVELERELQEHTHLLASADAELSQLLRVSSTAHLSELIDVEQRVARAREIDEQTRELESQIRDLGEGLSFEQLLQECAGVQRATLINELEELESRLEELDEELHDTIGEIKSLDKGLEDLRASEEGADAAQYSENLASEVKELVDRYVRVRLAGAILRREIERYREKNQGPVLSRARALFPRLTLGRYRDLRVGLEEQVILCVRHDGAEVEVSGLSEGAQYQLFLALRLATLEHYLTANQPMPLVLDDVLLHFDDDRARAAFEIFGELASRMQILFFTHHARHVELAREAAPAGRLFVHELEPPLAARVAC